ncbi:tRNA pseudouridine(55) synthase TruB [Aminipila terrae]|uniref:tRNA pseudouridine synthase B n=1 Tax=Aminipila terrae TaxID=2697030 RepID=A0A6P1MKP3_9FIRM|nr:tRNA pseudouridine(55) synthase TruB [Aminipila terrae]QHI73244.1 tRNA pseudouridine(55) synthase TruB [Aminipila terrae]
MIKQGIININKPKGYTSHDCVNVIRSLTGIKRVGHTGTLDPMAEGVLPVCIGSAARVMEYLDLDLKKYSCEILLGIETDTLDIWGEVVAENIKETQQLIAEGSISEDRIKEVLKGFSGTITQLPPRYSALKVNGRKLYEYARAGEMVEIASRQVYINDIRLTNISLDERKFSFEVVCSKGTYIRSICRDIGAALKCGAAMSGLTRTASGKFTLEDSVNMEDLKALKQGEDKRNPDTGKIIQYARALPEELNPFIVDVDFPLVNFGKIVLNDDRVKWFCDGGYVSEKQVELKQYPTFKDGHPHMKIREEFRRAYNAYMCSDKQEIFLGVAFFNEETKSFKADKVFGRG